MLGDAQARENTMKAIGALLTCVVAFAAVAEKPNHLDWKEIYDSLGEDERFALRNDEHYHDGEWIGSRFHWITITEELMRPKLQTDEQLWERVEIWCEACDSDDQAYRQRLFDAFRRDRDEANEAVDRLVRSFFEDETGDFRRQYGADLAKEHKELMAQVELDRERESMRTVIERHGRSPKDDPGRSR